MTMAYYAPPDWGDYTILLDGTPYNGTLTAQWHTAPDNVVYEKSVAVVDGVPQTRPSLNHSYGVYQVMYTLDGAGTPPYISEAFTLPDTNYPPNVPNPLNFTGGYKEINLTIQGEAPPAPGIDLYINDTKQDTITTSGVLTYSGPVTSVKMMIMDDILYENNPTGNVTKTFNLEKAGRQLNLADFSITEAGVTNNTGKGLPEITIYSV
jgi:hypothetical protein